MENNDVTHVSSTIDFKNIILYCRLGFESDCASEISYGAKRFGQGTITFAKANQGYVVYRFNESSSANACIESLPFLSLVFCRQFFIASDLVGPLSQGNRVAPLCDKIIKSNLEFSRIFIETADTNDAKQLSVLCRKLQLPFEAALKDVLKPPLEHGVYDPNQKQLHVFFTQTDMAYIGYSFVKNASPWQMGIPRLRFPKDAPSRSTLKLEEAFHVFIPEAKRKTLLTASATAVDLGASPGGWTWQFVNNNVRVTAVDNGNMDTALLKSGKVVHIKGDGFTYAPKRPVNWMVCDIVEQPARIAKLAAQWMSRKWCDRTIFNLKLPMKKRYDEVNRCKDIIAGEMKKSGIKYDLWIKHLYHDREEVTAYLKRK